MQRSSSPSFPSSPRPRPLVLCEVCVDSLRSAKHALEKGIRRLELCASLFQGGLTPSIGLLLAISDHLARYHPAVDASLYVMLRCRADTFCYTEDDQTTMLADLHAFQELATRQPNVGRYLRGFVFGALCGPDDDRSTPREAPQYEAVDVAALSCLLRAVQPTFEVTFHRALDSLPTSAPGPNTLPSMQPMLNAIQAIARANDSLPAEAARVTCLLTSCELPTGYREAPGWCAIQQVASFARQCRLELMVGGGVTPSNVSEVLNSIQNAHRDSTCTGTDPLRLHFSAKRVGDTFGLPQDRQVALDPATLDAMLRAIDAWSAAEVT